MTVSYRIIEHGDQYVLRGPSPVDSELEISYLIGSLNDCRSELAYRIRNFNKAMRMKVQS